MSDNSEDINDDEDIEDMEDISSNEDSSDESASTSDSDNDRISIEESKAGTSAGILFNFFNFLHM